jgi:uncharacterized membrane protein
MTTGSTTVTYERSARAASRPLTWVGTHLHVLVVWVAMAGWTAGLFALVRADFVRYQLGRFDLGNMVQAVWSTTQGRPLEVTEGTAPEQIVRLGAHVDPFLVLLAPVWLVWSSPLALVLAQIAALSLGALPVYWVACRHLSSRTAGVLLALAYLAYPWLAWSAVDAIHPVTFAIPLLLYCVYFLDTDRLVAFAACAIVAASTGELLGVTIGALGVWYALSRHRRTAGFVIAGVGTAWTLISLQLVIPAFSRDSSVFYGFYENVGASPRGVLETAVTNPAAIASELLAGNVLLYCVAIAAPLVALFLLAPGLSAVAVPPLAVLALADGAGPLDPRLHYVAAIVPFLVVGTVFGIARLQPNARVPAAAMVLVVSSGMWAVFGPWDGAPAASSLWYHGDASPRHVAALDRAVELVPERVPVSASNLVGGHLSARRYVHTAPILGRAQWVVLDSHDLWWPSETLPQLTERPPAEVRAFATRLGQSPDWMLVFEEDGVFVFRKRSG